MQIGGIVSMLRRSTAIRLVAANRTFLRLRAAGEQQWKPCSAAVIPAGRMAFIEATPAAHLAAIFVDADSLLGRRLAYASNTDGGAQAWSDLGNRFIDLRFWTAVDHANWAKAIEILQSRVNLQSRPCDTKMQEIGSIIRRDSRRAIHVSTLAARAALAPERLSNRFLWATGVSVRSFVQWTRLQDAVESFAIGDARNRRLDLLRSGKVHGFAEQMCGDDVLIGDADWQVVRWAATIAK